MAHLIENGAFLTFNITFLPSNVSNSKQSFYRYLSAKFIFSANSGTIIMLITIYKETIAVQKRKDKGKVYNRPTIKFKLDKLSLAISLRANYNARMQRSW